MLYKNELSNGSKKWMAVSWNLAMWNYVNCTWHIASCATCSCLHTEKWFYWNNKMTFVNKQIFQKFCWDSKIFNNMLPKQILFSRWIYIFCEIVVEKVIKLLLIIKEFVLLN